MSAAVLTLLALATEAVLGYPQTLVDRIGHPVMVFGWAIDRLERRLNRPTMPPWRRRLGGILTVLVLTVGFGTLGLLPSLLPDGTARVVMILAASTLLAQRSLYTHVADVARALEVDLAHGRIAVARIVGRDTAVLDEAGVARAAIESLAENFSDGVVAPAFWLLVLGLPGLIVYKVVNTADSMIGHRSPRYRAFGWAAARLDDGLNLIPARLAALILALAAARPAGMLAALSTAIRDAGHHRSPNAGWPEAAMAGALGVRLAGPRTYGGEIVADGWIGAGRAAVGPAEIRSALRLYLWACLVLWGLVAGAALLVAP